MVIKHVQVAAGLLRAGIHLAYGLGQATLFFPHVRPDTRDRLTQRWSRELLTILGVRVAANTAPRSSERAGDGSGVLVACNHISFLDILVINAWQPARFVSKVDVASWPVIGRLCRLAGTLFITRGKRQSANTTRDQLAAALLRGDRLAIFPEGTSSDGHRVLPFHGALFQAAVDAGAPVEAIALRYTDATGKQTSAPAYIDDITMIQCLSTILRCRGLTATLCSTARFAPPHADRRQLARQAEDAIRHALHPPDRPVADHSKRRDFPLLAPVQTSCNADVIAR